MSLLMSVGRSPVPLQNEQTINGGSSESFCIFFLCIGFKNTAQNIATAITNNVWD